MDISNLKEENLHPEAKILLKELREFYVDTGKELGLLLKAQEYRFRIRRYGAIDVDYHKTRACQIAVAELQMTKLIQGVG